MVALVCQLNYLDLEAFPINVSNLLRTAGLADFLAAFASFWGQSSCALAKVWMEMQLVSAAAGRGVAGHGPQQQSHQALIGQAPGRNML